jgi:hypothetical protein
MNREIDINLPRYDRHFFDSPNIISVIGDGALGGKATGLVNIQNFILEKRIQESFEEAEINIPRMVVLCTDVFDSFMKRNKLYDVAYSDANDDKLIWSFIDAPMPAEYLGDLLSLVEHVHVPLAIRSSGLLEDAQTEPFAGVYATKMIPNNQFNNEIRFHKLIEAVKYVFASTFFKASKDYFNASAHRIEDEKMAVIIQEVVGQRFDDRYYPNISGIIRSHNFYPNEKIKSKDGVVNLALGLGKTIVDGGLSWGYSPHYPNTVPPFSDSIDILNNTQTKFWSINMSNSIEYDPTKETEYLLEANIDDADFDDTLKYIASTYDSASDKFIMGVGVKGPRCLNFWQLLSMNEFRFNDVIRKVMSVCESALKSPVEIEFAANFFRKQKKMRFGFLQVRSMVISDEVVHVCRDELHDEEVLIASNLAMGNALVNDIQDIVFVKPEVFERQNTQKIAAQIDLMNRELMNSSSPYLLIGFGRWGSHDPWLGIPVRWGQIAGAKVIVESTLPGINVDLSQASHFFHNLTSFKLCYLSVNYDGEFKIDWTWLNSQKTVSETAYVKHVKSLKPLQIKVDGKTSLGIIKR